MIRLAALALLLAPLTVSRVTPQSRAAQMALWRLDCGQFDIDNLEGRGRVLMPVSCYLIRHGDQLVLFDAGLDASLKGKSRRQGEQTLSLKQSLVEQMAEIGVDPAEVRTLIVSHYHGDHHGQADSFPNARLFIGARDAAALRGESDKGALGAWLEGRRPIEEIGADRDLFGDGKIRLLFTPGHTPGHLALLVGLGDRSYVLTGDLVHMRTQLAMREPSGNHVDKVRGKAEIERVIGLAQKSGATIVIGHERADVGLLPAFPAAVQ